MRYAIVLTLLLTVVRVSICQAIDPLRLVPLPADIKERQERQRRDNTSSAQGGATQSLQQAQSVSIDRLKVQFDTPVEYQFEPLQTLIVQDRESSPVEEEKKPDQGEAVTEELEQQQEQSSSIAETEPVPEEPESEATEEVSIILPGDGKTSFRIVEENDRFIVLQVYSSTGK
ncbi:MAG TPA: hypothetical protein HPP97_00960 [Desulfuromonadales bacterium]|nr:hypothetical protein [Desulfuromonadales bacterium]